MRYRKYPIPSRQKELSATYHGQIVTRKMTEEEYRKYFGEAPPPAPKPKFIQRRKRAK